MSHKVSQPISEIEILFAYIDASNNIVVAAHLLQGLQPCPTMKMKLKGGESVWEVTGFGTVPAEAAIADPPKLALVFKNPGDSNEPLKAGQHLVEVR
ncbi:hypothetical protein [Gimesia aquarii]|uniref:Uncharacterized protein n=1 Tax=Gimesia aquarii TaxID=2527964 RepID=A0A517WVF9_9PLAN|nr:hypothetical protein [Gimesia aquarii]QDU09245.1 hypothetical protein V202x_26180 [Gimesia aquarii]